MPRVVFVAPYFMDATLRFVDAVASLPEVSLALVSADPAEKLPPGLRKRLGGHYRIEKPLDPGQLLHATGKLGQHMGGVDRLVGVATAPGHDPSAICKSPPPHPQTQSVGGWG